MESLVAADACCALAYTMLALPHVHLLDGKAGTTVMTASGDRQMEHRTGKRP